MVASERSSLIPNSQEDVLARLTLWSKRKTMGLARVEFSSEFGRQRLIQLLRVPLTAAGIPFHEIALPTWAQPGEVYDHVLRSLEAIDSGVVSISGFDTAFVDTIPLPIALQVINFNRENLARPDLRQIWWMSQKFANVALQAMPDLISWFNLRLFLNDDIGSFEETLRQVRSIGPVVTSRIQRETPVHNVPRSGSPFFVGRERELQQIHQQLQQSSFVSIVGMGGIGKSELAIQYAERHLSEYPGGICWLRARGAEMGLALMNFVRESLDLKLPEALEELSLVGQVQWCWRHWPGDPDAVLVILDDLDKYEDLLPYLPDPTQDRFKILATSRLPYTPDPSSTPIALGRLSREAGMALLAAVLDPARLDPEWESAQELCAWVEHLPLGIELLGRYLKLKPQISILEVRQRLQKQRQTYEAIRQLPDSMNFQLALATVLDLIWQDLPAAAQHLACLLSCFALAPIPWSVVDLCAGNAANSAVLRDDYLIPLGLCSPIRADLHQCHPLIWKYFSIQREQTVQSDTIKQQYTQGLAQLAQQIPERPVIKDIRTLDPAIPHLKEAVTTWLVWLQDDDLIWLFEGLGRFYQGQGLYALAEPWYEARLRISEQQLGSHHPDTATSLNNLAQLYKAQGRYEQAEPLFVRSLQISEEQLGSHHPDTATSLNNLAQLYKAQGRYEQAEPLFVRSLQISEEQLGSHHPDTATSLNNLAGLYWAQGRYEQAEPFYLRALAIMLATLGENHPHTRVGWNNYVTMISSALQSDQIEGLQRSGSDLTRQILTQMLNGSWESEGSLGVWGRRILGLAGSIARSSKTKG